MNATDARMAQTVPELVICIPGPWKDHGQLVQSIASKTDGAFLFAGFLQADTRCQDHVEIEFEPQSLEMRRSFDLALRGSLPQELLTQIDQHQGAVYIHFPPAFSSKGNELRPLRKPSGVAVAWR